jgi:hypothetical protein
VLDEELFVLLLRLVIGIDNRRPLAEVNLFSGGIRKSFESIFIFLALDSFTHGFTGDTETGEGRDLDQIHDHAECHRGSKLASDDCNGQLRHCDYPNR